MCVFIWACVCAPSPPQACLFETIWPPFDGSGGLVKGSWEVLPHVCVCVGSSCPVAALGGPTKSQILVLFCKNTTNKDWKTSSRTVQSCNCHYPYSYWSQHYVAHPGAWSWRPGAGSCADQPEPTSLPDVKRGSRITGGCIGIAASTPQSTSIKGLMVCIRF